MAFPHHALDGPGIVPFAAEIVVLGEGKQAVGGLAQGDVEGFVEFLVGRIGRVSDGGAPQQRRPDGEQKHQPGGDRPVIAFQKMRVQFHPVS